MRFSLWFDGDLPSSGNPGGKPLAKLPYIWAIRDQLHLQVESVYKTHPAFNSVSTNQSRAAWGILNRPINMGGRDFYPLARTELHLKCELDIEMHVNHDIASVINNIGDLDNRIKTLIDALRMPASQQEVGTYASPAGVTEYCCLLENDVLVSALRVEIFRHTAVPVGSSVNYVRLGIKVRLEPLFSAFINEPFRHD
jgi:hypothetical protein